MEWPQLWVYVSLCLLFSGVLRTVFFVVKQKHWCMKCKCWHSTVKVQPSGVWRITHLWFWSLCIEVVQSMAEKNLMLVILIYQTINITTAATGGGLALAADTLISQVWKYVWLCSGVQQDETTPESWDLNLNWIRKKKLNKALDPPGAPAMKHEIHNILLKFYIWYETFRNTE